MYLKIPRTKIARIEIVKTDRKLTLQQVVAQYKCDAAINGGLYNMKTGKVVDIPLRINGKTIANHTDGYWCLAWNVGPDIKMIHSKDMEKYKNVLACSAMLKDGKLSHKKDAAADVRVLVRRRVVVHVEQAIILVLAVVTTDIQTRVARVEVPVIRRENRKRRLLAQSTLVFSR